MTGRAIFNATIEGKNHCGRPPLWVMRQAGRYLPEYRKLKEKHSFVQMVRTPDLATEVTLQPLRRFELDAAIMFSDILVVPEAMGQGYQFRSSGGIEMTSKLHSHSDVMALSEEDVEEKLSYVRETLQLLRLELGENHALLGFCGSPWTLACYMIEGGSAEGFPRALHWAQNQPDSFNLLLEKVTRVLSEYLIMQVDSGVDAIQIFDSWFSLCPADQSWDFSLKWIALLLNKLPKEVPVILYANASLDELPQIVSTGPRALAVHHKARISDARELLPKKLVLQGNLDPEVMESSPEVVCLKTHQILDSMRGDPAHIMNLGHGIRPGAKIECMEALVSTVRDYTK